MSTDAPAPADSPAAAATTLPRTMRGWTQGAYGGPESVRLEVLDTPIPGAGEVLLRVRAASLNAADVHLMRGEPLLLRLFFGLRRPRTAGRGMDVAGTVVAVGPGVENHRAGDEVMGELPGGTLAEFVAGPAARLVARPAALPPADAASLPLAGGTAWQALELGRVAAGQRVLVIGASGGVGTFAVQLAALRGAEVWALCGQRSRRVVTDLGAARTFDYHLVDPALTPSELPADSFDAILDIAGRAPVHRLQRMLRPGGTLVMIAGEGGRVLGPMGRLARGAMRGIGAKRRIRPLAATAKTDITGELAVLAAEGRIRAVIERTWPLDHGGAALAHIDAGHTVGKVVVVVEASSSPSTR